MTALYWIAAQVGFVVIEFFDAIDIPVITPAGYRLGNWLANLEGAR